LILVEEVAFGNYNKSIEPSISLKDLLKVETLKKIKSNLTTFQKPLLRFCDTNLIQFSLNF